MLDLKIRFGLDFDNQIHRDTFPEADIFLGPRGFLRLLESQIGCGGYAENADYLRIELFRQALQQHLTEKGNAFFAQSFEADRFATAQGLLDWRDELLLAGWDFSTKILNEKGLNRLADLAAVELLFQKKLATPTVAAQAFGAADRLAQVISLIEKGRPFDLKKVILHEPTELLPIGWQRLFEAMKKVGAEVSVFKNEIAAAPSSVQKIAQLLHNQQVKSPEKIESDGSLLILKAPRETDAAVFLAQFLRKNDDRVAPVFIIPEKNVVLPSALVREGFADLGVLSASLARPALQLLKLAPAFVFEPIDVPKFIEFCTLAQKPLDDALALLIARLLAEKPGLENDAWRAATRQFFDENPMNVEVKKQFDFWFSSRRYSSSSAAPKTRVRAIYQFITDWASTSYENSSVKIASLLALAEQARRVVEVLDALPETSLTFLEIERIVRTIYQPSPTAMGRTEKGHFGFVHQNGGLASPAETVIWWNFVFAEAPRMLERWFSDEKAFLESAGCRLDQAERQNRLNRFRQILPFLKAEKRLILIFPEKMEGDSSQPHALFGDLEAMLGHLEPFIFDLEKAEDRARFSTFFALPESLEIEKEKGHRVPALLEIGWPEVVPSSEKETLTSIENLIFYPHNWFFRSKTWLRSATILSVTGDRTLLGNLAHRFFEELLVQKLEDFDRKAIEKWIDQRAPKILEREGATLLMYGREPERQQFLQKLKNAAWSLVSLLRENGWRVQATEKTLEGEFCGISVVAKPDLILARGSERAIIDLKWGGASRRRNMILNGEDLQLVLYARLLEDCAWPHTGYFVLEDGKMIARNAKAFSQALVPGQATDDHEAAAEAIFQKMERTFRWRLAQIEAGKVEVRTTANAPRLEAIYENEPLMDFFEMKTESSMWDEFRGLVR